MNQDLTPLVTQRVDALLSSREFAELRRFITTALNNSTSPDLMMSAIADNVLRPIASSISECSQHNNVVIFHIMITPRLGG